MKLTLLGLGLSTTLACAPDATGDWVGHCDLSGSGYEFDWGVELDLQDDKGDINGDVDLTVLMWDYTLTPGTTYYYGIEYTTFEETLAGDVDGSREGDELELELDVEGTQIDLIGVMDGDEMTGACTLTDDGANLGGTFSLSR